VAVRLIREAMQGYLEHVDMRTVWTPAVLVARPFQLRGNRCGECTQGSLHGASFGTREIWLTLGLSLSPTVAVA
jgi:hypothetical protein